MAIISVFFRSATDREAVEKGVGGVLSPTSGKEVSQCLVRSRWLRSSGGVAIDGQEVELRVPWYLD